MHRVLTAVITPFYNDGELDIQSLMELIRYQLTNDCCVVLFGTTGECPVLDSDERELILDEVKKIFDQSNFVVGIGGNNTKECIKNLNVAKEKGYKTFMITTPYYNKPTQAGLQKHFEEICNTSPESSFILYNVPGRTNVNLLPNTVLNIHNSCPNVCAIKEASGDLSQMILIRRMCPSLTLYSGDDGLVIPAMSIGAYGVISVLSNYAPKAVNLIVNYCSQNNYDKAFEIYSEIDDLIKLLFSETSPAPIKYLMHKEKLIDSDFVRLPLVKMQSSDNKTKIDKCCQTLSKYFLNSPGKY